MSIIKAVQDWLNAVPPFWINLILIVVILVATILVSRGARWFISKTFEDEDQGSQDVTRLRFFRNSISVLIWILSIAAIVSLIPKLRALAVTLFAGAGILVAIVGFAAQQAFSNIVSGIFIVLFKPFRVGDLVRVGELHLGFVEDITLRHTVITNFENKRIIIPNAVISSDTIVNESIKDSRICRFVEVGIAYDADVEKAMALLREICEAHPLCVDARSEEQKEKGAPIVGTRFTKFDESSLNLRAFVWTDNPFKAYQMHSEINVSIKKRFEEEGIEIPFPYRTVVYKTDITPSHADSNPK
jgi:small conductance mechanosensitive channel